MIDKNLLERAEELTDTTFEDINDEDLIYTVIDTLEDTIVFERQKYKDLEQLMADCYEFVPTERML